MSDIPILTDKEYKTEYGLNIKYAIGVVDGCIEIDEEVKDMQREYVLSTTRYIANTREKLIKSALIQLGWTPPKDQN